LIHFQSLFGQFGCSAFDAKAVALRIDCRGERLIILNLPWSKNVKRKMTSLTLSVTFPGKTPASSASSKAAGTMQLQLSRRTFTVRIQIIQIIKMSDISKVFPVGFQDGHSQS
jgi:hypothetical protein